MFAVLGKLLASLSSFFFRIKKRVGEQEGLVENGYVGMK